MRLRYGLLLKKPWIQLEFGLRTVGIDFSSWDLCWKRGYDWDLGELTAFGPLYYMKEPENGYWR